MQASNQNIYELVERLRLEVKSDIKAVADSVESIRTDVNKLKISDATLNLKMYALVSIIAITVTAGINGLFGKFLK